MNVHPFEIVFPLIIGTIMLYFAVKFTKVEPVCKCGDDKK